MSALKLIMVNRMSTKINRITLSVEHYTDESVSILLDGEESELTFIDDQVSFSLKKQNLNLTSKDDQASVSDCDCLVVVFSVADADTFKEAAEILNKTWKSGQLNTKAVIVVGNKTDLVRAREVPIDGMYMKVL